MSKQATQSVSQARQLEAAYAADVLKALSNPNRLRIFLMIRDAQPVCGDGSRGLRVGEIADALDLAQSTVSHYLRELEYAHLLRLERHGRNVVCTARSELLTEVMKCLASGDIISRT